MSPDLELQNIIESLLFVTDQPLTVKRISEIAAASTSDIQAALKSLSARLDESGGALKVIRVAGGAQMVTRKPYAPYLKKFFTTRRRTTLTRAALETLAIIAYKQPITRTEIEMIRGVNVDGVVSTLMERQLIEIKGRKDVPGNPLLYGTTKEFLVTFGLNSLKELPTQEELEEMFTLKEEMPEESAVDDTVADSSAVENLKDQEPHHEGHEEREVPPSAGFSS